MPQTSTINQIDLARQLGVSQFTVSAALSGSKGVSDRTRRRILDAATKHGYRTNRLAASLRGRTTASIGVIWNLVDPWAGDSVIALDLFRRMQGRGYAAYAAEYSEDPEVLIRQIDDLLGRQVDGLVIQATPSQLTDPNVVDRLRHAQALVAVCPEAVPGFEGDLVVHDRSPAIRQAVEHLVQTGRKRLAVATPLAHPTNPPKAAYVRDCCQRLGLPAEACVVIDTQLPTSAEFIGDVHGEALAAALDAGLECDALLCFNDLGAIYMLRELNRRGIRVPDEVALVGFNNAPVGRACDPPLATSDRHPADVADAVERLLNQRIEDPDRPATQMVVDMSFVCRGSAGSFSHPPHRSY